MTRRRRLTPEEEALWRRVAASVKPLRRIAPPPASPPEPPPRASDQPPARPPAPARPPTLFRPRPEPPWRGPAAPPKPRIADRGAEKRVRRGALEIAAALDLHGLSQDQAHRAVHAFLERQADDGARVVIVVTGKGGRLATQDCARGILKRRLPDWLDERPDLVAGYAQCHRRHGGEGAFYVFLKRRRDD